MISAIWSKKLEKYDIEGRPSTVRWLKTKKINIFFGANNSGKSRLIRGIIGSSRSEIFLLPQEIGRIKSDLIAVDSAMENNRNALGINGTKIKGLISQDGLFSIEDIQALKLIKQQVRQIYLLEDDGGKNGQGVSIKSGLEGFLFRFRQKNKREPLSDIDDVTIPHENSIYIPVLRGLRPLIKDDSQTSGYEFRTKEDYFKNLERISITVYTGELLYITLKKKLLGDPDGRELVKRFENLLSKYFFEDQTVTLIPYEGRDCVHVKIGDEDQFPIYDLGDGLQQCLIITAACFLDRSATTLIMIEEPELSLHPRILLRLVDFLYRETTHYYFITTHSTALLDLSESKLEITLNRVRKNAIAKSATPFTIASVDRTILAELGVKASSILLSNCTIWVEGITDRLYLRCYLSKYLAEHEPSHIFTEGFHYTFVEYSGSNLAHWYFGDENSRERDDNYSDRMSAICTSAHPFVICDGDVKGKVRGQDMLAQGARVEFLECKEIDNLVPSEALIFSAKKIFDRKMAGVRPYI